MGKIVKVANENNVSLSMDEEHVSKIESLHLCLRCRRYNLSDNCKILNIIQSVRQAFALEVPIVGCIAFSEKEEKKDVSNKDL